jgi:ATP-dependent DNA ligase
VVECWVGVGLSASFLPVDFRRYTVALDEHGQPSFQALQHRSVKRSGIVFYAFALLHLGESSYRSKPLRERQRALAKLTFTAPILLSAPLPGTPGEIERVVRGAGLEGVVA